MPTLQIIHTVTPPGLPARQMTDSIDGDNGVTSNPTVAVAKVGELTTRTDNDTGVITMESGHGFVTSDKLDVFWDGGSRRQMTATVATNAVTVDGGTGDVLPALNTDVTVMKPHEEAFEIDGDEVISIQAYAPARGYIYLTLGDDTIVLTIKLDDGETYYWFDDSAANNPIMITNPVAGSQIMKAKFTHDDSESEQSMEATALRD